MKRMHKIILCFTLLCVLICTTVFSASASYVSSETPREGMLESIVETNSFYNTSPFYYDYGEVNFEENEFSGQPIYIRDWDETNSSILGYDSLIRYNHYLIEGFSDYFTYDLDSYITADTAESSVVLSYFTHSYEFNLNDFQFGENYDAMRSFDAYVSKGNSNSGYDNIDACYFDGQLRFPVVSAYEVYSSDGNYYDVNAGLRYIRFEFIPYQVNEFVQPFVEVGKTVFTDFDMGGVYEYDSISFTDAVSLFFRDAYGFDSIEFGRIEDELYVVDGCYRLEFAGDITRQSSTLSLTVPYLNETRDNYNDSFPLPFVVEDVQVTPFEWLLQSGQAALEFELLPNLTVGHILLILLAIPILIAALRLLAGG